jgi:uncharacterized damage-inducible protein DinB
MLLGTIRRLWEHAIWADRRVLEALPADPGIVPEAILEAAHLMAAEEIWLARLEQRPANLPVWPDASLAQVKRFAGDTHAAWRQYVERLQEADLASAVNYRNSAGGEFTNTVGEILLHAALHGQYHRGKINLMLRRAGLEPAPADYIAFLRGVPAATQGTNLPDPFRQ